MLEGAKTIATFRQKAIGGDAVHRISPDGLSIEHRRAGQHALALGACRVPAIAKTLGHMQNQTARGAALPLLLQQLQQLRAGEVHADQGIVKGHDAEQLAVADGQAAAQVGAHTAGVGKRDLRRRRAVRRARGSG